MKSLLLYVIVPLLVLAIAGWVYLSGGRYITTENAYVRAGIIMVSANVSGEVQQVMVAENEAVIAGDILFTLDPQPFDLAVNGALAELEDAKSQITILRAQLKRRHTQRTTAEEIVTYEIREMHRLDALSKRNAISLAELNAQAHRLAVARNSVAEVDTEIGQALAELAGNPGQPIEDFPVVRQATAALNEALLNRQYATVRARVNGVVARIDLHPGEYVRAGSSIFSMVETGRVWIEANLKETQLTHISTGQTAILYLDSYPDIAINATVSSISPASGSEYAVLPPQNATGNWVKVTQRIPVRLEIGTNEALPELRAGMSTKVVIDTHRERSLSDVLSWISDKSDHQVSR